MESYSIFLRTQEIGGLIEREEKGGNNDEDAQMALRNCFGMGHPSTM